LKRAAKQMPLVVSAAAQIGMNEALRALVRVIDGERATVSDEKTAAWVP
jgi:hypothetical protein